MFREDRGTLAVIAVVNQYMITNLMLPLGYKSLVLNYEPRATYLRVRPPSAVRCRHSMLGVVGL